MFENEFGKSLDRRSFLRGSALFAGALGLAVVPALAQQSAQQPPEKKEEPKDPFADDKDKKDGEKKLIDDEGREYRVCPQCGYNMYKQGRMWVCDNCGYSYVE
ncbi:MAG: twin-arginine translocation signal domain-containing protein [Acidobacteria bacterium]|nr:twin-arginine translocation signal domain-containing protein [Acidobacteriota bacterium]